ncbi:MAG: glycosyltransferase family 2 protein [Cytophagaceae bacterium]
MAAQLVSVVIPTYNRPHLLINAIESVLVQSYRPIEILVINNGDASIDSVIQKYKANGNVRFFESVKKGNVGAARNKGIKESQGMYIGYLDDDDVFLHNHIEALVKLLTSSGKKVAYSGSLIKVHKKIGDEVLYSHDRSPYNHAFDLKKLFFENYIPTNVVLHHRDCVEKSGYFDEDLRTHEDWDFWLKLAIHFEFVHSNKVTSQINVIEKSDSVTNTRLVDFDYTRMVIYDRYSNHSSSYSVSIQKQAEIVEKLFFEYDFLVELYEKKLLAEWKRLDLKSKIRRLMELFKSYKDNPDPTVHHLITSCRDKNKKLYKIQKKTFGVLGK